MPIRLDANIKNADWPKRTPDIRGADGKFYRTAEEAAEAEKASRITKTVDGVTYILKDNRWHAAAE